MSWCRDVIMLQPFSCFHACTRYFVLMFIYQVFSKTSIVAVSKKALPNTFACSVQLFLFVLQSMISKKAFSITFACSVQLFIRSAVHGFFHLNFF